MPLKAAGLGTAGDRVEPFARHTAHLEAGRRENLVIDPVDGAAGKGLVLQWSDAGQWAAGQMQLRAAGGAGAGGQPAAQAHGAGTHEQTAQHLAAGGVQAGQGYGGVG